MLMSNFIKKLSEQLDTEWKVYTQGTNTIISNGAHIDSIIFKDGPITAFTYNNRTNNRKVHVAAEGDVIMTDDLFVIINTRATKSILDENATTILDHVDGLINKLVGQRFKKDKNIYTVVTVKRVDGKLLAILKTSNHTGEFFDIVNVRELLFTDDYDRVFSKKLISK